jgi:hypothetical protein
MITVQIVGLAELARKYGVNLQPALRAATWGIGEQLRGILAKYPKRHTGPVKWTSRKQQIFYYAMRRKQGLPLRYVRQSDPMSQRLGPSWTVAHKGNTDATVGTRATYAKWVQSAQFQQPMHAETGWITDEAAIEKLKRSGVIQQVVRDAIMHAVR